MNKSPPKTLKYHLSLSLKLFNQAIVMVQTCNFTVWEVEVRRPWVWNQNGSHRKSSLNNNNKKNTKPKKTPKQAATVETKDMQKLQFLAIGWCWGQGNCLTGEWEFKITILKGDCPRLPRKKLIYATSQQFLITSPRICTRISDFHWYEDKGQEFLNGHQSDVYC